MADLHSVMAALSVLDVGEFQALIVAANRVPHTAPGLRAWIEHAADWETHRRAGSDFPLRPPDAAIPPEEDVVTLEEAVRLRAQFAQEDEADAPGVANLLDAVVGVLTGGERRH